MFDFLLEEEDSTAPYVNRDEESPDHHDARGLNDSGDGRGPDHIINVIGGELAAAAVNLGGSVRKKGRPKGYVMGETTRLKISLKFDKKKTIKHTVTKMTASRTCYGRRCKPILAVLHLATLLLTNRDCW